MKIRFLSLPVPLFLLLASPAVAESDCMGVNGIRPQIGSFLAQAEQAQAAGEGTMPIQAVLFGVTAIDAEDQGELDARPKVALVRRTANGGDYESRGPKRITVEGIFAERETLFRLPPLILGRYRLEEGGASLTYDPKHAVEVGERVLGIPFYMQVHRMEIKPDELAFYFAGNDDANEPDRCYKVQ